MFARHNGRKGQVSEHSTKKALQEQVFSRIKSCGSRLQKGLVKWRPCKTPLEQRPPKASLPATDESDQGRTTPQNDQEAKRPLLASSMASSNSQSSTTMHEQARYWGPTGEIDSTALIKFALKIIDPEGELGGVGIWVREKKQGSYNTVYILQLITGYKIAIKVPAVGQSERWTPEDAYNLRSEALTMRLIRKGCPEFPIPEVYAYSTDLDNEIGAPYIAMEVIEGVSACDIWCGNPTEDDDAPEDDQNRYNLLGSLAYAMARLRSIQCRKTGTFDFDAEDNLEKPKIGPIHTWHDPSDINDHIDDLGIARKIRTFPPGLSARAYFRNGLVKKGGHDKDVESKGVLKVALKALECDPFARSLQPGSNGETFVLQHPDFNLQNIICNPDTGEVTGIIDWDGVKLVPRCIGYASVPIWLREDWLPGYFMPDEAEHSVEELEHYREYYANCMAKAMGGDIDEDCVHTAKSAIYTALDAAIYGDGHLLDFTTKLLGTMFPRQSARDYTMSLGEKKWCEGERYLGECLSSFLAADTPDEGSSNEDAEEEE
ncbi:kinase-like protein [Lophium mytilinum]|uniref:Kinase-like protein n=1 Tax=Lophium mytilinum TaxID=390894 RepID=A0A6A6QRE8_9PEZI|nr:kinase-like protein [Lophium mytilinum]